jgi:hypothetical protein
MIITINTKTKTLLIEEPITFAELNEFVKEFNLESYIISIKQSTRFTKIDSPLDIKSPYVPPYKPYCEDIKYIKREPSTIEPITYTTTGKWTPFGPTED